MTSLNDIRPIDIRRDMDAIAALIDVAFGKELEVVGTDIRTEIKMIKKLVPIISILQLVSNTFRHVFDGFVIEDQGQMVSLVNISRAAPKSKRWVIGNVATHPDYRRKGLARKLVTRAIENAKEHGAEMCTLEVRSINKPAYELYKSLGFSHYDSISELKLEKLPEIEPIILKDYSTRSIRISEWEIRYKLAKQEVPAEVQAFLPVSEAEFHVPPIALLFDPIARWAQKIDEYRWGYELDDQLVGYMFLGARKVTKVTHRLTVRILPQHSQKLFEAMLTRALITLQGYPQINTLTSVRSSYRDQLATLKRYGFKVYDEMHRLGLILE